MSGSTLAVRWGMGRDASRELHMGGLIEPPVTVVPAGRASPRPLEGRTMRQAKWLVTWAAQDRKKSGTQAYFVPARWDMRTMANCFEDEHYGIYVDRAEFSGEVFDA